ncbi:hypothetical protein FRB90_010882 [Tulasnella sp. 427]|nr:hypothetical protein FRB90_010882 [Tulasnella sp. 427]
MQALSPSPHSHLINSHTRSTPTTIPSLSTKNAIHTFHDALPNLLALVPAFVSFGVHGIAIPSTDRAPTPDALPPRCDTCSPGVGSGIVPTIHSSADIVASLRLFTQDHLAYTSTVANVFAQAAGDVKATAPTVLGVGSTIFSWTSADLLELSVALDAYVAGTISTEINVFAKAGIDIASFTKAQAGFLQAFLITCVTSDVNITVATKVDLVKFVGNAISVAGVACTDLNSRVQAQLSALIKVVAALKLEAKVATCVSAAAALKLAIHAYASSLRSSTSGSNMLLLLVNAWIAPGFGAAAGLLNLGLKAATDVTVCKSIVASLLALNSKLYFFGYIKLDAVTCYQLLSAVVAAN